MYVLLTTFYTCLLSQSMSINQGSHAWLGITDTPHRLRYILRVLLELNSLRRRILVIAKYGLLFCSITNRKNLYTKKFASNFIKSNAKEKNSAKDGKILCSTEIQCCSIILNIDSAKSSRSITKIHCEHIFYRNSVCLYQF